MEFIPLIQERCDLVLMRGRANTDWIEAVLRTVNSEAFKNELRAITGYDLSRTGHILDEG
ncbi:hypothetical protein D3C78_1905060 [compost metagenome]